MRSNKLLIPVGTVVNGKVSAIDAVPKALRTMQAANGNFSPVRKVHVQFDELVMANGRTVCLHTFASPAPDGVLRFVSANEAEKKNKVQEAASNKVSATRQAIRQQWNDLQKKIHEAGKMNKVKEVVLAQVPPVHPQYLDAGTSFNANLLQPLDFGTEAVKREAMTDIGVPPPTGSVVHARLETGLSSATAKKGDPVEAVITEPLVASDHLILPEGNGAIKGSVMEVAPARRLGRNGRLRILFCEVAPPNGIEQKVETNLEGVAVAKGEHLKLDNEGGAEVTTPRTRYLTTGIQVMLSGVLGVSGSRCGTGRTERG